MFEDELKIISLTTSAWEEFLVYFRRIRIILLLNKNNSRAAKQKRQPNRDILEIHSTYWNIESSATKNWKKLWKWEKLKKKNNVGME